MKRLHKLRCGGCGHARVTLRGEAAPGQDAFTMLVARCTKCKSRTVIMLSHPAFELRWPSHVGAHDGDGILSTFREG